MLGKKVMTPHGLGVIMAKDFCNKVSEKPELGQEWTGRWGVKHLVYPIDKPVGMYTGDLLYYTAEELGL